jgi:hypothetical protein
LLLGRSENGRRRDEQKVCPVFVLHCGAPVPVRRPPHQLELVSAPTLFFQPVPRSSTEADMSPAGSWHRQPSGRRFPLCQRGVWWSLITRRDIRAGSGWICVVTASAKTFQRLCVFDQSRARIHASAGHSLWPGRACLACCARRWNRSPSKCNIVFSVREWCSGGMPRFIAVFIQRPPGPPTSRGRASISSPLGDAGSVGVGTPEPLACRISGTSVFKRCSQKADGHGQRCWGQARRRADKAPPGHIVPHSAALQACKTSSG